MVLDSKPLSRFAQYNNNFAKFTYTGGVCTLLPNISHEPDTMFSPVYTDVYKRPSTEDVTYVPYIAFDLDIKLSAYASQLASLSAVDRTSQYAELVINTLQDANLEPTLVVGTGAGVHAYYELHREDANSLSGVNRLYRQASIKDDLLQIGLDVASCNVVSSLRVPNTVTSKHEGYVVKVLHAEDNVHELVSMTSVLNDMHDVDKVSDIGEGRNVYLYRLGIKLLYQGYNFSEVEAKLEEEYILIRTAGNHPFARNELNGILRSLSKARVFPSPTSVVIKEKLYQRACEVAQLVKVPSHQDVYHAILTRYALVTGNCFPISQKELAQYVGMSQPQVSRVIKALINQQLLEVINDDYVVGRYCKTYTVPHL